MGSFGGGNGSSGCSGFSCGGAGFIAGGVSDGGVISFCDRADCGLLVDVTNLFINSRNHGFDPPAWLDAIDVERIVQLHIVGYSMKDGRHRDGHGEVIQPELLELAGEVKRRAPVRAVILERDEDFPEASGMDSEWEKLRRLRDGF